MKYPTQKPAARTRISTVFRRFQPVLAVSAVRRPFWVPKPVRTAPAPETGLVCKESAQNVGSQARSCHFGPRKPSLAGCRLPGGEAKPCTRPLGYGLGVPTFCRPGRGSIPGREHPRATSILPRESALGSVLPRESTRGSILPRESALGSVLPRKSAPRAPFCLEKPPRAPFCLENPPPGLRFA